MRFVAPSPRPVYQLVNVAREMTCCVTAIIPVAAGIYSLFYGNFAKGILNKLIR
jgi:hypothetical protein